MYIGRTTFMGEKLPPPLEWTFNVGEHSEDFEEYIRLLRDQLTDPDNQDPPLANHPNLHLLRRTTRREPRRWLHLRMVADNDEIIVWIRTDNLYVVGFEQVRGGRRYETNPDDDSKEKNKRDKEKKAKKKKEKGGQAQQQRQPLIPGATFLGFGGGYGDLGELQSLEDPTPGSSSRPSQEFGWQQLADAIRGLATYTREAPGNVRRWLRTIVVTVSESLRLHNVCQHIGQLLRDCTSGWLTQRLIDCIHDWGDLSACVIASATDPEGDARGRYSQLSHICENTDDACTLVAILNTGTDPDEDDKDKPGPSHRRPKREAAAVDGDVPGLRGLTFVEIFSAVVQLQGSSSSSSTLTNRNLQLYGHIAIDDGLSSGSSQLLFMRGRSNALPSADGHVQLTGPARAVWGYGEIVMRVDLMDAIPGFVADMTPDDEIGSGKLVWNTYDTPAMVYDEVEEYVFEGVSGNVNVRCAVITNAVVATVVLRRRTGTSSGHKIDVYGTVSAATAMFGPQDKVTLFDREWKDAVSVGTDDDVPLLRNVVVVPLRSALTICADLWTRAQVADMSADDRISSGPVAVFLSSPFGVVRKGLGGGDLEVSVTWSLN